MPSGLLERLDIPHDGALSALGVEIIGNGEGVGVDVCDRLEPWVELFDAADVVLRYVKCRQNGGSTKTTALIWTNLNQRSTGQVAVVQALEHGHEVHVKHGVRRQLGTHCGMQAADIGFNKADLVLKHELSNGRRHVER